MQSNMLQPYLISQSSSFFSFQVKGYKATHSKAHGSKSHKALSSLVWPIVCQATSSDFKEFYVYFYAVLATFRLLIVLTLKKELLPNLHVRSQAFDREPPLQHQPRPLTPKKAQLNPTKSQLYDTQEDLG